MSSGPHRLDPLVDWEAIRSLVRQRMAFHLRGWDAADIEDAVQDALLRFVRMVERDGSPRHATGAARVIARRTAIDQIRARTRSLRRTSRDVDLLLHLKQEERAEWDDLLEEVRWKAFQVLEYFRAQQAPCLELALARARGLELKQLAAETNQSHAALLQRWSRCMKRLNDAIRVGRLPWSWPGASR